MTRVILLLAALFVSAPLAHANPSRWAHEWPRTDFSETSVKDWSEIMSGGPPKDGIPAIDDPQFLRAADATALRGREPVITVGIEGAAPRAFPVRYLMWHEIVNDSIGAVPVAVTYCPLCNSGMTFDRRVGDRAWPLTRIRAEDGVQEAGVSISWQARQASALDTARIANGREVGTVRVRDAQGRDVAHDVMFAFAFHAFWPDGTWMVD